MKKNIVTMASVLTIVGAGLGSTALAHAASGIASSGSTTAQTQRLNRRHIRLQARLNQAVRDGTITAAQKSAFLAELKTLRQQRATDGITKSSSAADRQAERDKLKSQLESWAASANFPLSKLMPRITNNP